MQLFRWFVRCAGRQPTQFNHPDAVGKRFLQPGANGDGQPCFANATRADQADTAVDIILQLLDQRRQFMVTTHQRGQWRRQIATHGGAGGQGGQGCGQARRQPFPLALQPGIEGVAIGCEKMFEQGGLG